VIFNVYTEGDLVSLDIRSKGQWDSDKTRVVLSKLREIPSEYRLPSSKVIPFVDVGGNLGWFTMTAAAFGFRVHTFEPMPSNILLLRKTLCENQQQQLKRKQLLLPNTKKKGVELFDVTIHEGRSPS
jgi:hypothetical protein